MATSVPETVWGLRFTLPLPGADTATPGTLAHALREGFPLLGEEGRPLIAARVVLRRAVHHFADSLPRTFRDAGVRAAHDTARRITGVPRGGVAWGHPPLLGDVVAR
ncbi:hypothetical protein EFW17_19955 [Halostreptopolyspora alba]|uniref:Uncharacterized protein n=1 Tax=Halostreptopolyspora alba TaxID=2487137 RepID=A0A3N0E2X3_9ACTN|nr:hypothetical protein EFW17_19955 [Nocardiopsaceae bacterium YIM 96095]